MSSLGLNIGLQALLTSQAGLDTIGHNISNAATAGYSRQSLHTGPARTQQLRGLLLGSGVQADVVKRVTDDLLNKRLIQQTASFGRQESRYDTLSRAELLFSGFSGADVGQSLDALFASISSLSSSPSDSVLRDGVVHSGEDVSLRLRQLAGEIGGLREEFGQHVTGLVREVNVLAEQISSLNREVVRAEAGGGTANDLRDRREETMRELAKLVDVRFAEDRAGVRVLVNGHMLVGPSTLNEMGVTAGPNGDVEITLGGTDQPIDVQGGAIGGVIDVHQGFLPGLADEVDEYARNLIFEFNKLHSTSIPASGSFTSLVGSHSLQDQDGDGLVTDELVAKAGLPFDPQSGELQVRITDQQTGQVTVHTVPFDPARTTVGSLVGDLNSIDHLAATVDGQGRLRLSSGSGYAFDFSREIPLNPDAVGSFGGGRASLGTAGAGPFGLNSGDTLDLVGPAGTASITFNAASFTNITQATAAEIAAVINADPGAQANGLVASDVGGHLALQTAGTGSAETFQIQGGAAAATLGWTAGTTVVGSDDSVDVTVTADYAGLSNAQYTFQPNMDGTVGNTPGLVVDVLDENGLSIASLDVGAGYTPGDPLGLGNGIQVSFGLGDLSATDNDRFVVQARVDSDTADLLAALGLNGFFSGSSADSIHVRDEIVQDSSLFAASTSGAAGGGQALLDLLGLADRGLSQLEGQTLGEGYTAITSGVGFEVAAAQSAMGTEQLLLDGLQARRDQISGVNIDEELVNMIEYEQAFTAASQYIRVISDVTNELLALV